MRIVKAVFREQLGGDVSRLDITLEDGAVIGVMGGYSEIFVFDGDPEAGANELQFVETEIEQDHE